MSYNLEEQDNKNINKDLGDSSSDDDQNNSLDLNADDLLNEDSDDDSSSGNDIDTNQQLDHLLKEQEVNKTKPQPPSATNRRAAIKAAKEESKSNGGDAGFFEDIGEDFFDAQREINQDSDQLQQQERKKSSLREKLKGGIAVKSFVISALDKGLKAMQNLKDNVVEVAGDTTANFFSGQEKKQAQKRLSEDLTMAPSQQQQISASKNDAVQVKSAENSGGKAGGGSQTSDEEDAQQVRQNLNFDDKNKDEGKKNKKSNSDSSDSNEGSSDDDDDDVGDLNLDDDDDDDEDDSEISETERKKLLAEVENEDDDEDESDDDDSQNSSSAGELSNVKDDDNSSMLTDDIANRSLNAEDEDSLVVIDSTNYLKYVSDKHNLQTDVIEVVDKNERSFKQVAERHIAQTSYLIQPLSEVGIQSAGLSQLDGGHGGPTARRLIHLKPMEYVADRYHGDPKAQQGFPYSIAAFEQFIAIGSSDGSVRVFDNTEREIKVLMEKSVKGVAVMALDMQRSRNNNLFIITGHSKGQLTLHELKGLKSYKEVTVNNVPSKHHKTITDIHQSSIISVKFIGELGPGIQSLTTVSCDLDGVVYICLFKEGLLNYSCNKQCFMRKRVGPTFSISPLIQYCNLTIDEIIQEQLQNQIKNGGPSDEIDFSRKKPQLVAFGALERIIIAQIRPQPKELLFIERPDYIEIGTVPYLDWGLALSPCFRDKSYPTLAIAWGKVLQLGIYLNYDQPVGTIQDAPLIQYDGYYVCEHTIDTCFFLGESIIFLIVNKKEVRILYSQNLTPGLFDETYQLNDPNRTKSAAKLLDPVERTKYFIQLRERFSVNTASTYAEKDKGYRLLQEEIRFKDLISPTTQQRSKYNYNPTICKNFDNMVVALGKSSVGTGKLVHWEEYLDLIRKTNPDDWLKVLRASLDIFNGKMVGLAGLPDQKETREQLLREKMKELLRQNIDACIREFQEGECVSNKTLRVALEFCIRVNAIEHLFGELFQMFAEAGMEQRFFENLEPFILSGKFKQTKIPKKILTRLIGYYRQKDPELLEKALLNIDLSKYSESFILENTVCLQLLCSLYNLRKKSKYHKTKQDIFKLQYYDPQNESINDQRRKLTSDMEEEIKQSSGLISERTSISTSGSGGQQQSLSKWEKLEIEQSGIYIGYKLMWLIKLYLEGKKFPQGTLSAFKWRIYVYDIVRFATNEEFLTWFLEFDPDTFFKLLTKLFIDPEPYEYIISQTAFIEMYKDTINGLDACMTHSELIDVIQQALVHYIAKDKDLNNGFLTSRGEGALNSFIHFIAQISRKPQLDINESLCIYVIKEQLKFTKKLLKIPNLLTEELSKVVVSTNKTNNSNSNAKQESRITRIYNLLIKRNEKDVINLLQRCESDLEEVEIHSLLKDAERSPMFKVKVYLHQMLGNYEECLQMYFKIPAIREDVFQWLNDIQKYVRNEEMVGQLKQLILSSMSQFVEMDASLTIRLCQNWLDMDHIRLIDALHDNHDLIFKYLSTLLQAKEDEIEKEYNHLMISGGKLSSRLYNEYKELILRFIRVLCEKKYRMKLVDFVKKKYYPIDECLTLIRNLTKDEGGQQPVKKITNKKLREDTSEAQAILLKRKGEYIDAVNLFTNFLIDLSIAEVVSALYLDPNVKFADQSTKNEHIQRFDSIILYMINMCDKYGSRLPEDEQENLWLHAIKSIYRIKQVVFEKMRDNLGSKDQDKFSIFHMIRVQEFMKRMSEHVNLRKILVFLEEIGHPIKYQEFRQTFEDKVRTELHHENILASAKQLLIKDLMADTVNLKKLHSKGGANQKQKCDYCKRDLLYKWDIQNVVLQQCGHIFHQRCVQNTNFQCFLCFNEFDQIQMIINQRGVRRMGKKSKDLDSGSNSSKPHEEKRSSFKKSTHNKETPQQQQQTNSPKKMNQQMFEKQQRNEQLETVQKLMYKFDCELNDKIIRLDSFA